MVRLCWHWWSGFGGDDGQSAWGRGAFVCAEAATGAGFGVDSGDVVVHVDGSRDGAFVDADGAGIAEEVQAGGFHDARDAHGFGEQWGEDARAFGLAGGDAGAIFAHDARRVDRVDHGRAGGFGEAGGRVDDRIDGAVADAGVAPGALGDEGEFLDGAGGAVDEGDVGRRGRGFEVVVGELFQV